MFYNLFDFSDNGGTKGLSGYGPENSLMKVGKFLHSSFFISFFYLLSLSLSIFRKISVRRIKIFFFRKKLIKPVLRLQSKCDKFFCLFTLFPQWIDIKGCTKLPYFYDNIPFFSAFIDFLLAQIFPWNIYFTKERNWEILFFFENRKENHFHCKIRK